MMMFLNFDFLGLDYCCLLSNEFNSHIVKINLGSGPEMGFKSEWKLNVIARIFCISILYNTKKLKKLF